MFALTDQVAVITGGAKGIGRGIAGVLSQAGARVVITDIDETTGQEAARELGVEFELLDVSSRASWPAAGAPLRHRVARRERRFTGRIPM
jgi:3-oxoacyl-[acyl-carrier protein] reductase